MYGTCLVTGNRLLIDIWRPDAENVAVSRRKKPKSLQNSSNLFIMGGLKRQREQEMLFLPLDLSAIEFLFFFIRFFLSSYRFLLYDQFFFSFHFQFHLLLFDLQHFGGVSSAFGQSRQNNGCDTIEAFGHHLSLRWHWFVGANDCCTARCYCWPYSRWLEGIPLQGRLVGPYIYNE